MERLQNRRAVVTGGAQGIGEAIARRLAAEGARVAILDLDAKRASAVLPTPHIGIACDISDRGSVDRAFAQVDEAFGGVDILVNNAGLGSVPGDGMDKYYAAQAQRLAQISGGEEPTVYADQTIHCEDAAWARVLDITLNGAFRCSRAAVRLMARDGTGGSIVNIASTSASNGNGPIPYCVAKAGIIGMTRAMARELAERAIRVNAVNPGATRTPLYAHIPEETQKSIADDCLMKRLADPAEVAGAVAFLASDDASYATGSVVSVNGGAWFD
ncbi:MULTISPECIES: SDR family NAD(P)-dependent oxidoreductase [Novosphingobium]|uniref:3-oxoacyl-[acyl-carrier protein] reductase n=1 Tax=Novosphingobium mathurense TaxID=428990 RepID=A0A1U6I201_9SPHN|nr:MULTISPECIES: SDR family oxidoreductase [Novosphingobium]SLK02050.1 3-oxoacyl-[acyl-carrier protein] reductase [Novosphingobium mathurense]